MEYEEIKKLVDEQYTKAGSEMPVPVVSVAKNLGIVISEIDMPTLEVGGSKKPSGILTQVSDIWTILLNKEDAHTRKRFTIAHEIGHFLLHKTDTLFIVDSFVSGETFYRTEASDLDMEKEANFFAASLLMPETKVRELFATFQNPSELANQFGVSEVSMTFRLKNLGLIEE